MLNWQMSFMTLVNLVDTRIRDLYNKITVSDVIFDSPVGPEVLTPSPQGKFQTQLRITFEIYEEL